ncbi:MAG: hypothetical protein Kow0042_06520 [Calditrichia bacterium]
MKFSWFYFDLICRDDLKVVVVFYGHPFFLTFDISLLDISIYRKGKKTHYGFPVPVKDCRFQTDPINVSISKSILKETDFGFHIDIREPGIRLKLDLSPKYSYWESEYISLFKRQNYFFNWRIPGPQLESRGFIETEQFNLPIDGIGYLDFNEGNFPLNVFVKSWVWGRIHSPSRSVVFGSLIFQDSSLYQPVWIFNESQSRFQMSAVPLCLTPDNFSFFEDIFEDRFKIQENKKFDQVLFLISKLPTNWTLFRKIHEFIFYRLDEQPWGRKFNRFLANVDYQRYWLALNTAADENFIGILESINFK